MVLMKEKQVFVLGVLRFRVVRALGRLLSRNQLLARS
jgi:hypothetical protein